VQSVLALAPHDELASFERRLFRLLSLAAVFDRCSLYDNVQSRVTPRYTGFGSCLVLGRLPKPEPKPRFFGKTESKRNRGFRRPNGRFGFGGSAYMVLVTVRVFVTGL